MAVDEAPILDLEMEMETNVAEIPEAAKGGGDNGGKRKRGRSSKALTKAPVRKTIEEDVCFICFDGGDLVLCDRRGCPKAYHPSCVNRDEAFFRAKGRWNCGWHLCSNCQKNAYYMCYTCTFSLCKGCIKDAVILCVRGNKGFCETCMRTVMLIESNEHGNKEAQVDFDDKSSWEYLFKDYWIDLKAKLSLSSNELTQAKNPWKGSDLLVGKQELPEDLYDTNYDRVSGSDSSENVEAAKPKRRKAKKRSKSIKGANVPNAAIEIYAGGTSTFGDTEWASKELLEFVMHMKNGDRSILSQFDVQALLLEYIKRNELRDPRRKSQIICDSRLENLFGKARVGHFEMLKLLESHFLIKEDSQREDTQGTVVDTEVNQLETDGNTDPLLKGGKDKRRKTRKRGDDRGPQSNLDDYAAINNHNINLIYLRRKLIEDLLEDIEKFHDKVVGTFVRIRISGSNQKQDIYRLVQVVGTSKASEPYKVGKRATDIVLEILNLNKTEIVSIDTVSNQEFTEDECKRLRQSIKCGLINRLTVGDILEKATELQASRVNDWLETEIVRLSHLRDRASEKGRRKELRECVEKLQLLKTPEERRRRLEEIPEIQADPNMDPSHESEEEDSVTEDNKQEIFMRARSSSFGRKGREPISPRSGSFSSQDSWSGMRKSSNQNWELNRTMSSKNYLKGDGTTPVGEILNETSWNQNRDQDGQLSKNLEKLNSATDSETGRWNDPSVARSESLSGAVAETAPASLSARLSEAAAKISETDKIWHYKDPSGKVQGPFSIVQLRKWSNTGYFPADLRIWRTTEKQDDSILLTDVLAGRFQKELPSVDNSFTKAQTVVSSHLSSTHAGKPSGLSSQNVEPSYSSGWASSSAEVSKLSTEQWVSGNRNDSSNLPSPTPKQNTQRWNGGQASENKWSPNSVPVQQVGTVLGSSSYPGGNLAFQSLSVATPDNGQLTHSAPSSSINASGSKEHPALESRGTLVRTSVLNSGGQLTRGSSENDALSSRTGITPAPAPNPNKGIILGSTNALPNFQPTVTDGSHGVHPSVETQSWGSASIPKTEMVAQCPAPGGESQAWGSSAPQKLEPNSSIPAPGGPGQPAAYGQWGTVLSAVQNPSGNLHNPGFSGLPPPDPWRTQIPASQSNMQPPAPPNVPWGIGITENNAFAPGPRPDNPNAGWGLMPGNANMAWGGPVLGSTNLNSGAIALGPTPGNANLGWVQPAGTPGATIQGPVSGNPGWIAPTGNPSGMVQGPAPGNANPGWAIPTGNQGGAVQGPSPGNGNPGWVASTGNPGAAIQGQPGNSNPGWVAPAGNQGMWGAEQQRNGDRFSGQRDRGPQGGDPSFGGGRPWNRQSSFGRGGGPGGSSRPLSKGQRVCVYHENGHCKKGASCDYMHT